MNQELVALSQSDVDGPIYAVTYTTDFGVFSRQNGIWVQLSPNHDEYDGMFGTFIDPEKAEEFIAEYDKGGMTIETADTFQQMSDESSMTAAGGLDRNRGNAERLRRYWVRGEGAAKIRWGTPGDWARCVRHLSKYMGPRAKGYCQLRHKDALGIYTATHARRERNFNLLEEFTHVTEEDMAKPLGQIFFEEDSLFDKDWEPSEEIVIILDGIDDLEESK